MTTQEDIDKVMKSLTEQLTELYNDKKRLDWIGTCRYFDKIVETMSKGLKIRSAVDYLMANEENI